MELAKANFFLANFGCGGSARGRSVGSGRLAVHNGAGGYFCTKKNPTFLASGLQCATNNGFFSVKLGTKGLVGPMLCAMKNGEGWEENFIPLTKEEFCTPMFAAMLDILANDYMRDAERKARVVNGEREKVHLQEIGDLAQHSLVLLLMLLSDTPTSLHEELIGYGNHFFMLYVDSSFGNVDQKVFGDSLTALHEIRRLASSIYGPEFLTATQTEFSLSLLKTVFLSVESDVVAMKMRNIEPAAGAYIVFMEEFRKEHKEKHPDVHKVFVIEKAGKDKWRTLSDPDKSPYIAKALKIKSEYTRKMEASGIKEKGDPAVFGDFDKSKAEENHEG